MHPPVRLIAIDMDGTLLDAAAQAVSERNYRALRAAQASGITIAIATGRRTAYCAPLLTGHGLAPSLPILSSNGAVTRTLGGELLAQRKMPASVARALCALMRPFGVVVFTFDRGNLNQDSPHRELVVEDLDETSRHVSTWAEANRNSIEIIKPLERAFDAGDDPIQGMVAGPIAKMRAAQAALEASPLAALCASFRTEYPARDLCILDLMPLGVSKATALKELCAQRNIDRAATMAIGDNWNDLEMLAWVAQGVLMGNAAAELKSRAKLEGWKIAPPNVEDGVAVILERVLARQNELAAD